ncbi:hypothetical protein [Arachidicoccus sp.]|jgi:hypothetical protein|uniref:hypothetical protein n=1 Tax=Arachidicoccus sp. TaxID=1872624 RepID=UPI003D224A35
MKKLFLNIFLLVILAFAIACSKSINSSSSPLKGQWELRHAYGGILGFDSVYAAGNGNTILFTQNDFSKFKDQQLTESGFYSLHTENGLQTINFKETDSQYSSGYKILNDALYLDVNALAYDGIAKMYVKISE